METTALTMDSTTLMQFVEKEADVICRAGWGSWRCSSMGVEAESQCGAAHYAHGAEHTEIRPEVRGIAVGLAETRAFWIDFLHRLRRCGLSGVEKSN
ncbi:hypothetical protein HFV02_05425 [Acidithiobacillus caldus]|jgi:hypothetical protein|nr:hypothetical protein [Acidithiobacillus caldus]AIA55951.1 hypothetical protein Acaty_c2096 [Acidithiobacillus caldus ATCC 51756]MBU2801703.1 hypothetical protein [Acidithiobacillus caldus]OFC34160.1 hypothetical protein BAE27_09215 [Acidithiobacillus caldus]OFC35128.1 hypothetical protein BAE28_11075 [Acidithiobacillus caldus]OFC35652.1 hypothetical protein BAE29_15055 [Acidithiobacillus caldus]